MKDVTCTRVLILSTISLIIAGEKSLRQIFLCLKKKDFLPLSPISQSARFCIVHPPMPEGTKMLRTDPRVVNHAENEYRKAHVRRWGVSEI